MENLINENSESIKFEDFNLDENTIEKSLRHYVNKSYFKVKSKWADKSIDENKIDKSLRYFFEEPIEWNNKLITDYNNTEEVTTVAIVREIIINHKFVKKNCIINESMFYEDRNILNTHYSNWINKYDEAERNFVFESVKKRIRELLTEDAILIEYKPTQEIYDFNFDSLDDVEKKNIKIIEPDVEIYDFAATPKVKPKNILGSIFSGLIICAGISIAICTFLGLLALSSLWSIILGAVAIFISTLALACFIYNLVRIKSIMNYLKNPKNNFENMLSENEIDNSSEINPKPQTINHLKFFR